MNIQIIWLTKLILCHLITDFVLQPNKWITDREQNHFASQYLYWHGIVTTLFAGCLIGFGYWKVLLIILVTHVFIDGLKSYRSGKTSYFLIDQALHILVILACYYFTFLKKEHLSFGWEYINTNSFWIILTAFVFLTYPAGILIGQLTNGWRAHIQPATGNESLGHAGKWIGIIERIIIMILVLEGQYEAIGLLVAAKSIVRFSDSSRTEAKTEYLLIGTLISIGLAVITGLITLKLISMRFLFN
jgi:uncharacterized membrane protein